jgi:hypothetical protein
MKDMLKILWQSAIVVGFLLLLCVIFVGMLNVWSKISSDDANRWLSTIGLFALFVAAYGVTSGIIYDMKYNSRGY